MKWLGQGFWNFTRSRSREIQIYLRNPAKLTKTREIPRNLLEILPNTCWYNIFETYLGYWSCLLAVNVQIYLESSSLPRGNNVPKLPGVLRLMLRKPGHNKREDFSLTLYGTWKETAVCSNAGTCLIVRAGHDRRHQNVLTSQMDLNLPSRTILPCKLQSNTRERWEERNLLRCCFRLEIGADKGGQEFR